MEEYKEFDFNNTGMIDRKTFYEPMNWIKTKLSI